MRLYWVVNCFQNCILVDYSQAAGLSKEVHAVVNCFQNCILVDYSQEIRGAGICP